MPRALQVVVRRDDSMFLAECVDYPLATTSEFLNEALCGMESEIRTYLEERDAWEPNGIVLFISLYFGRFGA